MMFHHKLHRTFFALAFCVLSLVLSSQGIAQTPSFADTTKFHFWYTSVDARSMAMANATVADPINSNGLYSNPGLLPFTSHPPVTIHSGYNSRYNIFNQNLTVSLLEDASQKLMLGASFLHNGSTSVPIPNTQQLLFSQFNLDVAYGQMLTSSLSIGAKVNMNYGNAQIGKGLLTANSSIGLFYSPSSSLSYGLAYKGTGYQNYWLGSGLYYYRSNQSATGIRRVKVPHRLEIGATLRFPSLAENPNFVLSFSNEKLFGEPGLVYRGGLEIYLLDHLTLRGGYFHSSFTKGARMGFGLILDPFNINYAFTNTNLDQSGRSHLLSITLDI